MKRIVMILLVLTLTLVACNKDGTVSSLEIGGKDNKTSINTSKDFVDNYVFKYNGINIGLDDEAQGIIDELGEPIEYFEAPSCAYQGLDKIYYYSGFEMTTYTINNIDYIANVVLVDDSVATQEGIYIGSMAKDVLNKYGLDYDESINQYIYTRGNTNLQFIFDGDEVISIMYNKVD